MFVFKKIDKIKFFSAISFLIITLHPSFSFSDDKSICEKNIIEIERQIDIPKGLLKAIGLTESGRYLDKSGPTIWPWTVNVKTKSLFFDNKSQMLKFLNSEVELHDTIQGKCNFNIYFTIAITI